MTPHLFLLAASVAAQVGPTSSVGAYCLDPAQNAAVQAGLRSVADCYDEAAKARLAGQAISTDAQATLAKACDAKQQRVADLFAHCRQAYCVKPDEQAAVEAGVGELRSCITENVRSLISTDQTPEEIADAAAGDCTRQIMKVVELRIDHCNPPANPANAGFSKPGGADVLVWSTTSMARVAAMEAVKRLTTAPTGEKAPPGASAHPDNGDGP